MRNVKQVLIPAMAVLLIGQTPLWAAGDGPESTGEETPSFNNAAQAERAANLASASFTDADMAGAQEKAAADAKDYVEGISSDYADGVVEQISTDYADKAVDDAARAYADDLVETKAREYAETFGEPGDEAYEEAYAAAKERATDRSFHNAWDTAYEAELARLSDPQADDYDDTVWKDAYGYAHQRATSNEYHNAWQTAYEYAYNRATNPDYPNAYQAEYKRALEREVADITGAQLMAIHQMRYVEKLGWGVINKRLDPSLHPSTSGLGNKWKHQKPPSVDDVAIPPGPDPEDIPLEQEIAEATRRNTQTGWSYEQDIEVTDNGNKGSKKVYGLARTSGRASQEARGKSAGNSGADTSAGYAESGLQADNTGTSKSSKGNSGKSQNSKGSENSGKKGGNDNGSKGGNSNKNDKSDGNGNNGGNGNKGGNGKNK